MTRPGRRRALAAWLLGLALLGAAGCASSGAKKIPVTSTADLTNPFVGPEYAQWLVGPVSRLATAAEVEAYVELRDDAAAAAFIDAFWARRNPFPEEPGNQLRERFEARAAEADRKFSEAGYAGRRTARGTVFVVYGPPEAVEYEIEPTAAARSIEVWSYPENAAPGLDGRRPNRIYRFTKEGDLTVFYSAAVRERQRQRTLFP
jgi:GWxTD domain-containing protein